MKLINALFFLFFATTVFARSTVDYLPPDADPDPSIPTPESVLGWEVGDWHVSHDKLVQYMQALAAASDRVSLKVTGQTYEQRPLLQLAITSAGNQDNLESLRQAHLDGGGPLVVWLGYSVHGNEASGSNAALLLSYYLASSRSDFVTELLEGSIVLVDPSINPDGLNRFASWANSNAGKQPVADPLTRQHLENWVNGRTNHYWFDLNRDWLPLVHPSSRARISEFHRWLPHVLTDHHEQGGYPGFFFQPGVPSRQNPLTPTENLELTRALATWHSEAFDEMGQPHFTEDAYDDFYYGKGSTYPDINGSVGILFEQKSIRGQALETSNGIETFQSGIANQLAMSLSTLEGSWAIRDRLKRYQAGFHDSMLERAAARDHAGWVIGDDGDPGRARAFLDVLDMHRISYQAIASGVRAGGHDFTPGQAWFIPARQRQFGLLEAIMEQRTEFQDNTFYDVSAWTLPLAYNLPFSTVSKAPDLAEVSGSSNGVAPDRDARAWVVPWNQLAAPPLLQALLEAGARPRAAMKAFSAQTRSGLVAFQPGAIVLQAGIQDADALHQSLEHLTDAALAGTRVYSLDSTMTVSGPDLGAIHFKLIEPIRPLIVGGKDSSSYDTGEQWFLLDQRLGIATPIVESHNFNRIDLADYTHILMADGSYKSLRDEARGRVEAWVSSGGVLITAGRAASWAESLCFGGDESACTENGNNGEADKAPASRAYADFADDRARQVIGGAIVATVADLSHPLAFGYQRSELPLFRRGTKELRPSQNAYSTPVRYTQAPLLAGFIGPERLEAIKGQPAVIAEKQGKGLVVRFGNTPLFRGFWRGTERLFVNALYLGQTVSATELPKFATPPRPEVPRR